MKQPCCHKCIYKHVIITYRILEHLRKAMPWAMRETKPNYMLADYLKALNAPNFKYLPGSWKTPEKAKVLSM